MNRWLCRAAFQSQVMPLTFRARTSGPLAMTAKRAAEGVQLGEYGLSWGCSSMML